MIWKDLEGLMQFKPFYDMLFSAGHSCLRKRLNAHCFSHFQKQRIKWNCSMQVCMHKLGLLKLYQVLEREPREVHTIPKMTAYEQQTSSSQMPYRSLIFPLHTDLKNFLMLKKNNWLEE